MSTHITGKCPHCKAKYRLRAHAAGRRARCTTCNQVFVVPGERLGATVEDSVVSWLNHGSEDDEDRLELQEEDEQEDEQEAQDAPPNPELTTPEKNETQGLRPPAP